MSETDPLAWWLYVDDDLLMIDAALAYHRVSWQGVAYHAQQASEKALKSIIVARGLRAPRTHDVAEILRVVQRLTPLDDALMPVCEMLTELGSVGRYPDDTGPVTESEARDAAVGAREVVAVARGVLLSLGVRVP